MLHESKQARKSKQASQPRIKEEQARKQGSKPACQQASKRRSKEAGKEETKSEAASKYVRKKMRENKNRRRKERKHRLQAWSEGPVVLDAACVVRDFFANRLGVEVLWMDSVRVSF